MIPQADSGSLAGNGFLLPEYFVHGKRPMTAPEPVSLILS